MNYEKKILGKNNGIVEETNTHEVLISSYTWKEYQKIATAKNILIIPFGAFEQHGPHLPLATDTLLARVFAEKLASNLGSYMTETFAYGMRSDLFSGGGETFPGTCSLNPVTFLNILDNVLGEFYQDGFRQFVLLNAHYENSPLLREGARQHVKMHSDSKIIFTCWWDMLPKEKIVEYFPAGFPGMELEHAGFLETSVMLYFYPDLVRSRLLFPHEVARPPGFEIYPENLNYAQTKSGSLAPAHLASVEMGKKITTDILTQLISTVKSCFEVNENCKNEALQ